MSLSRRQFVVGAGVTGAGLLAGCGRLPWQAQAPPKPPRLGFLDSGSPESALVFASVRQGLYELGLVEGQNLAAEYRYDGGVPSRLPSLAAELAESQVDLIVAAGNPAVSAAKNATGTTPIVGLFADPVGAGLVSSLAQPGGNVTGLSYDTRPGLAEKRLELLKAAAPGITRVALLWDDAELASTGRVPQAENAAHALSVQLQSVVIKDPADFDGAFEAILQEQAEGLLLIGGHFSSCSERKSPISH